MKKLFKNLFAVLAVIMFIPFLNAEIKELDKVNLENFKSDIIDGIEFTTTTKDEDYTIIEQNWCRITEDQNYCYSSSEEKNNSYKENDSFLEKIEKGVYKYSIALKLKEGVTISEELSSINLYINETSYYGDSYSFDEEENILYLEGIYMVYIGFDEISNIVITGVTSDFKVGDTITFTGKTNNDKVKLRECWYFEPEDENEETDYACSSYDYESGGKTSLIAKKGVYKYSAMISINDDYKDDYIFAEKVTVTLNNKKYSTMTFSNFFRNLALISQDYAVTVDLSDSTLEEKNNNLAMAETINTLFYSMQEEDGKNQELIDKIKSNPGYKNLSLTVDTIEESKQSEVEKTISENLKGNTKVLAYYDINIKMEFLDDTSFYVTDLLNPIKLTFALPEVPALEIGYNREYKIIRIHGTQIDELPVTINGDGTYSFETDKFSNYILAYTDIAPKSPSTGDNIILYVIISLISLIVITSTTKAFAKID